MDVRPLPDEIHPSIQESIHRQLNEIAPEGPGTHVAFVLTPTNTDVKTAVMVTWGDKWSFSGFLDKKYSGPLIYGAELKKVF